MRWPGSDRRGRRLLAAEAVRVRRRMLREDVTVFGEQLGDLHVETLTTELDEDLRRDYQTALDDYERAKARLAKAEDEAGFDAVDTILDDGRYAVARVLARRDGVPLPERHGPCFFNAQHGPAVAEVPWTPPGGVERPVPVCRADRQRLADGHLPQLRMVMVGGQLVPWWRAGSAVSQVHDSGHAASSNQRFVHFQAQMDNIGGSGQGF